MNSELKIYTQDHGVFGAIIVTAFSEEEARIIMEKNGMNYEPKKKIEEHNITGFVYENLGDT